MLSVRDIMTPAPQVIDASADSATAIALMDEHQIRHLPVVEGGKLIGVVSERDLRRARSLLDHAPGEIGPPISALCSRELLTVGPDERLDVAATAMADRKAGSLVVVEGEEIVGIVTTVDLCRCVAKLALAQLA